MFSVGTELRNSEKPDFLVAVCYILQHSLSDVELPCGTTVMFRVGTWNSGKGNTELCAVSVTFTEVYTLDVGYHVEAAVIFSVENRNCMNNRKQISPDVRYVTSLGVLFNQPYVLLSLFLHCLIPLSVPLVPTSFLCLTSVFQKRRP